MIAGGRSDDFSYLAGVDIFDAYSQQWIPAAPLLSPRCNFGMATVDDSVYAVGGSDPFDTVRSIEIYDSQRWKYTILEHTAGLLLNRCSKNAFVQMPRYFAIKSLSSAAAMKMK
ncbi:unnamed protein product [Nippostrongylus brasiliensis]|uniref:Kelch repeat protein n=1 Tax=Nippostrongylus brasiliensis TaxID=27835 RepID=A0A0N4YK04_NIPBR|nr:unnamed protein product [Nippostrongylus brasiliensis]